MVWLLDIYSLHLPPKGAKNKKLEGIRESFQAIGGFTNILPIVSHPQT
jgi:hypothetical protein